jgi:hypothetical protein
MQVKMKLTDAQAWECLRAAIHIEEVSEKGTANPQRYNKDLSYYDYIIECAEAIASEWVVANYFSLPFDPYENKFKVKADVGKGIEVRWTKYVHGQLIIHEYDRPTDIAVLVTGKAPYFFIAGWIPIAMAQKPRYKHSKQPNWWVTQINLQPIANLVRSSYGTTAI